eukprot:Tbor_TRINITY_DN5816_c2_g1::TRINITY_DN5816_c2_g1_i1::g.6852::m.6852
MSDFTDLVDEVMNICAAPVGGVTESSSRPSSTTQWPQRPTTLNPSGPSTVSLVSEGHRTPSAVVGGVNLSCDTWNAQSQRSSDTPTPSNNPQQSRQLVESHQQDPTKSMLSHEVDNSAEILKGALGGVLEDLKRRLEKEFRDKLAEHVRIVNEREKLIMLKTAEMVKNEEKQKYLSMMSAMAMKFNRKMKVKQYFLAWQQFHKRSRRLASAVRILEERTEMVKIRRAFWMWRIVACERKCDETVRQIQQACDRRIEALTAKHDAEVSALNHKIFSIGQDAASAKRNCEMLSEQLKAAFMRGVCAINLEAVQVLQRLSGDEPLDQSIDINASLASHLSSMKPDMDPGYLRLMMKGMQSCAGINMEGVHNRTKSPFGGAGCGTNISVSSHPNDNVYYDQSNNNNMMEPSGGLKSGTFTIETAFYTNPVESLMSAGGMSASSATAADVSGVSLMSNTHHGNGRRILKKGGPCMEGDVESSVNNISKSLSSPSKPSTRYASGASSTVTSRPLATHFNKAACSSTVGQANSGHVPTEDHQASRHVPRGSSHRSHYPTVVVNPAYQKSNVNKSKN